MKKQRVNEYNKTTLQRLNQELREQVSRSKGETAALRG